MASVALRAACLLLPALGAWACATGAPEPAPGSALAGPVIEEGGASRDAEARAAALLDDALAAREAGRSGDAAELASAVVERYPSTPVSGRALWLVAEASLEDGRWREAASAAERYAALLGPDDPRLERAHLLAGRASLEAGDPAGALGRALTAGRWVGPEARDEAIELARAAAADLDAAELAAALAGAGGDHPLAPVLQARRAALLQAGGEIEAGREVARAALEAGATGADSVLAERVVAGELAPARPSVRIGSILPATGPPSLREFARRIAEGLEVAAATSGEDRSVSIEARDDRGDPTEAVAAVRDLEAAGVAGAVGFIEERTLDVAAEARAGPFLLVSPTARSAGPPEPGAYTLAGADPAAATAVAEHAAGAGYRRVALVHSRAPESVEEADAFESRARSLGLAVAGRFPYDVGATYFQEQIGRAREVLRMAEIRALGLGPEDTLRVEELDPVALFAPAPAEDVELLAPQLTFFGLDTLGIDVLGTSGWTGADVLATVDRRHTDGVVATAPVGAGSGSAAYARFREAYERHFERSLVSPVPALGYDAGLLLLHAVGDGRRSPEEARRTLERLQDLQGATGTFYAGSDGRILRRHEVVRIVNRSLVPVG